MRNWIKTILFVLCGIIVSSFIACSSGDDDDGNNGGSGSNNSDGYKMLVGKWTGSSNDNSSSRIISMTLNTDKSAQLKYLVSNGKTLTTAKNDNNARFSYNSTLRQLQVAFSDNTNYTFEKVSVNGDEMEFYFENRTFLMKRSAGTGSDDSSSDYAKVKVLKILDTWGASSNHSYSSSDYTAYLRYVDGKLYLYTSAKNLIGAAKSNTDSKRGPYKVSQYSYRVYEAYSLNSNIYYYFN